MQGSPGWPRAHRRVGTAIGQAYNGLLRGDAGALLAAMDAADRGGRGPEAEGDGAGLAHAGTYVGAEAIAAYLHRFAERWDELLVEAQPPRQEGPDRVTIRGALLGRPKGGSRPVRAWFVHRLLLSHGRPVVMRVAVGLLPAGRGRHLSSRA